MAMMHESLRVTFNQLRRQNPDHDIYALLSPLYKQAQHDITQEFLQNFNPEIFCAKLSKCTDDTIRILVDDSQQNPKDTFIIWAIGGYGRGELCPKSDLDCIIWGKPAIIGPLRQKIAYFFWNNGQKINIMDYPPGDMIKFANEDPQSATSLINARLIMGDYTMNRTQMARLHEYFQQTADELWAEKKRERASRCQNFPTRFMLEPNIKEGKGALRDVNFIEWAQFLLQFLPHRQHINQHFTSADQQMIQDGKWQILMFRILLHLVKPNISEILSFDDQRQIWQLCQQNPQWPEYMGEITQMMRQYFLTLQMVGAGIRKIFSCDEYIKITQNTPNQTIETAYGQFAIMDNRCQIDQEKLKEPTYFLDFLRFYGESPHKIHSLAYSILDNYHHHIPTLAQLGPAGIEKFMAVLCARGGAEKSLRLMKETGILGRLIPHFAYINGQMQFNAYHSYTTCEHTIRAIGILNDIELGQCPDNQKLAHAEMQKINHRHELYIALLYHDIAKGYSEDHCILGDKFARAFCPTIGFTPAQTELVAWLVRYHLSLSDRAFRRDLDDDLVIQECANFAKSPEHLRLLYILTIADITAVGPNIWNGWKANLLHKLYSRTMRKLNPIDDAPPPTAQNDKRYLQYCGGWGDEQCQILADIIPANVLYALDSEQMQRMGTFLLQCHSHQQQNGVEITHNNPDQISEIAIYTSDRTGLLSALSGVIALFGYNVMNARIHNLHGGMVLDIFKIQNQQGQILSSEGCDKLTAYIMRYLTNQFDIHQEIMKNSRPPLPHKHDAFAVIPAIDINNQASPEFTIIELHGRDRTGLLYCLCRILSNHACAVHFAKIASFGETAIDVFYITDNQGKKCTNSENNHQLQADLTNFLHFANDPKKPIFTYFNQ